MDWSNAYNAVRQGHARTPISELSHKHRAAVVGNLIIGRASAIWKIWVKYDNQQLAVPLEQRKVSTEESDSRRSGGKSEDWKPLSDILAKKAEGDFDAAVDSSKIVNGTARFAFSETSSGSAPVIALIANAAAAALMPEKGNEAEEIKIEAKIDRNSTVVQIHLHEDRKDPHQAVQEMGNDLNSLIVTLSGLDAGKAMEALRV